MQYSSPILKATTYATILDPSSSLLVLAYTRFSSLFLTQKAPELGPGLPLAAPSKLLLKDPILGGVQYTTLQPIRGVYSFRKCANESSWNKIP